MRFCASEERAVALFDEDMEDRVVEGRVRGMPVCFPAAICKIEFDSAANWVAAVDANGGVGKIGTRLAIPNAELDDLDFVAGDGSKATAEITGEPACLKFQLARRPQDRHDAASAAGGGKPR